MMKRIEINIHTRVFPKEEKMQRYTSLEATGSVEVNVQSCDGGIKLTSTVPFACDLKDQKILLHDRPSKGDHRGHCVFLSYNDGSIIVNGVDVTLDVKEALARNKGELDDRYKVQHVVEGIIKLSVILSSGVSKLLIYHPVLLDTEKLDLDASGNSKLAIQSCLVDALAIKASHSSSISGFGCFAKRIVINVSGSSKVSQFHAFYQAILNANDMTFINITADATAGLIQNKSDMAKISIRH